MSQNMRKQILSVIAQLLLPVAVLAEPVPGDVDPSFVYPRPQAPEPDSTNAIALADGFVVVKSRGFEQAGSDSTLELTRIDEDGHVVTGFGSGGTVTITMPGAVNAATAVKGLMDGSMLLAGFQRQSGAVNDNLAAIARLGSTGHLDPTFGVGGVATFDVTGQLDRVGAIDVLPDGRIVAGVWSSILRDPYDCSMDRISLVRLNPDGTGAETLYANERSAFGDSCRAALAMQVVGTYRQTRFTPQDPVVNVAALNNAVELIQLFPPGAAAKNGADIKLCLDATEDMIRFPHITTLVIIGADSDYERLVAEDESPLDEESDEAISAPLRPEAIDLIRRPIGRLAANKGEPWVLKAAIRPMVLRLDPTFDEKSGGAATFSALLKKCDDVLEVRKGQYDQEYRVRETTGK